MCGANRSHSNKTTSRKFRKSVDSVSGPRTELNIAAIVTSLQCFGTIFKANSLAQFHIMPSSLNFFTIAICNSNTPDKKFKKPVRLMFSILMIESIQFGSDKMDKYLDK